MAEVDRLAEFQRQYESRKGSLELKNRGLLEVTRRHYSSDSHEQVSFFGWLLEDDTPYESEKVVKFSTEQGWHELIQKAIAIASPEQLHRIVQKFDGSKVRGVSGDAYGTLVLQQLLQAALLEAEQNAAQSQPNEPNGLARTIFSTFKTYLVDHRGIIDSSCSSASSDKQVVQSAIFVVQKFLMLLSLLPEEEQAFKEVVEILGDNAARINGTEVKGIACSQTGCRNYQRILEIQETPSRAPILRRFVKKLLEPDVFQQLVVDQYANYVLQHIINQRSRPVDEKLKLLSLVDAKLAHYSTHVFARHIVQRCFESSSFSESESDGILWSEAQGQILKKVFRKNGSLKSEYVSLQKPLAEHVLAQMKKAGHGLVRI